MKLLTKRLLAVVMTVAMVMCMAMSAMALDGVSDSVLKSVGVNPDKAEWLSPWINFVPADEGESGSIENGTGKAASDDEGYYLVDLSKYAKAGYTNFAIVHNKQGEGQEAFKGTKVKMKHLSPFRLVGEKTGSSSGSSSGKVTSKSSNKSVATVDASGVVTAVGEGKATITAETFNGKTATCAVNVYGAPVMAVMDVEKLSLAAGQKTTLNATALTKKGAETPAAFTYTVDPASADPACVSVDEETGEVLALHRGQAVIRALAHNGIEARCAVTVAAAPADIRIEPASDTIGVKETYEGLVAVLIAPEGEEDCANDALLGQVAEACDADADASQKG